MAKPNYTKEDYEQALFKSSGKPVKLTDAQYQQILKGQKLTQSQMDAAHASGAGVSSLQSYDMGGSAPGPHPTAQAPLPASMGQNVSVPKSMAEGSPWWADPSQQWQPYQGPVAASSKAPSFDLGKGPKDAAKYSGFEDDSTNVGGANAGKGTFNSPTPAAVAAKPKPTTATEETYASAFGPVAAAPAQKPGEWQSTGNPMDALNYAKSMSSRASNRARWDEGQQRWVSEFEDAGLTPTGLRKGPGVLGYTLNETKGKA